MHYSHVYLLIAGGGAAVSLAQQATVTESQKFSIGYGSNHQALLKDQTTFTALFDDDVPSRRIAEIERKRQGYLYGPSLLGNTSYFPTGALGNVMVQQHTDQWLRDASWITSVVEQESNAAMVAFEKASNISCLCRTPF